MELSTLKLLSNNVLVVRVAILLTVLAVTPVRARPKLDVLVMNNGDRLTCEIKKLQFGQLHVKIDYTIGTVIIDWEKVRSIESPQRFVLENASGAYRTGVLREKEETEPSSPRRLEIVEGDVASEMEAQEVVWIGQLERNFVGKLTTKIDYGFTFSRANSQIQSTLNGSLEYHSEKRRIGASVSSLFAGQSDGTDTNRHNASASYFRYIGRKWLAGALSDFLTSDQQRLDLRTTLGSAVGRRFINTNRNTLSALGGAVWNREQFTPESGRVPVRNNGEALFGLEYSTFRFDSSEFVSTLMVFPSLTDAGRLRLNLDMSIYWDIVGDLYWRVSAFENFDSRPPAATPRNDFGVTTSIGWSF